MDLRKKPSGAQRYAEMLIRFRLPLLALLLVAWWFLAASWSQTLSMVLGQAERNAQIMQGVLTKELGDNVNWIRFGFVTALFLVLRTWLGGWAHGARTLLSLALIGGACWVLDGSQDFLPVLLGGILVLLATFYIFARNTLMVAALASALTLYFAASWVPGVVQAKALGWQVIIGLVLADLLSYVKIIASELKKGRRSAGAIVTGVSFMLKPALASVVVLLGADVLFYYLEVPTLQADNLLSSVLADMGYIVSAIVIAPVLFSLSPLNRAQAKKRKIKK